MARKTEQAANTYIPKDYTDLYKSYVLSAPGKRSLTATLINHFVPYATEEEREDLASTVMLRCLDKDVLKMFDPTKANFGGVIFFVTRSVCVNHLSRNSRDPIGQLKGGTIVESSDEEFEAGTYQLDRLFEPADSVEMDVDKAQRFEKLLAWATELAAHPTSKRDKSILPLLKLVMEIGPEPDDLSKALGVTTSTCHNWLAFVRAKAETLFPAN